MTSEAYAGGFPLSTPSGFPAAIWSASETDMLFTLLPSQSASSTSTRPPTPSEKRTSCPVSRNSRLILPATAISSSTSGGGLPAADSLVSKRSLTDSSARNASGSDVKSPMCDGESDEPGGMGAPPNGTIGEVILRFLPENVGRY